MLRRWAHLHAALRPRRSSAQPLSWSQWHVFLRCSYDRVQANTKTNTQREIPLGNHNAKYVVAVVEVDETGTASQDSDWGAALGAVHCMCLLGLVALCPEGFKGDFVLRTYREPRDDLPLYRLQREGGGSKRPAMG